MQRNGAKPMRMRHALALGLGLLGTSLSWAGEGSGGAAAYRQIGVGARAIGQGGAVTASIADATATYWNPAGLSRLEDPEVAAMTANLSLDRNLNYLAYGMPVDGRSAWGFSYTRFSIGAIPETRVDGSGNPIETDGDGTVGNAPVRVFSLFGDTEENVSFGYSRELSQGLRVGASMRYLRQELFDSTANGVGIDLGVMYEYSNRLAFGLAIRDLAENLDWSNGGSRDSVDTTTALGVAFRPTQGLNLNMDISKTGAAGEVLKLGAEKWFQQKYGLRLGADDGDLTAGASMRMKDWQFDFAYAAADLGDIQRLSLLKKF